MGHREEPRRIWTGETVVDTFPPFPHPFHDTWVAQVVSDVVVRSVTARWHHCGPNWTMPTRQIPDDMIFYVTGGQGTVTVDERAYAMRAGVCAHFKSGVWHSGTTVAHDPIRVIAIHYRATVFESLSLSELLGFPDLFPIGPDLQFTHLAEEACRLYGEQPAGYARVLEGIVLWMLLHLIWCHGDQLTSTIHQAKLADLHRLRPSLEAMRTGLENPQSIATLARRVGLSVAQYRRVFQRTFGVSPVAHLRRLRMEQACRLLQYTDRTVESIAQEVGYAEPSFFARTFKQMIGTPPGAYRRRREL